MKQQADFLTFYDQFEIRTPEKTHQKYLEKSMNRSPALREAHSIYPNCESLVVCGAAGDSEECTCFVWIFVNQRTQEANVFLHSEAPLPEDLANFVLDAAGAVAREGGCSRIAIPAAQQFVQVQGQACLAGFTRMENSYAKDLSQSAGVAEGGRAGEKGSSEMLTIIDMKGTPIAVLPRRYVEEHNLLHAAIGVLVHNSEGKIYVHQRSPDKSMHGGYFDMFVGGLVLAGEAVPDAARNEVKEELGIEGKQLDPLFEVVWLGQRNRVVLSLYRVEAEDCDVSYNDGEVVWGKFMSLSELETMMATKNFVPGGKKAWEETVTRGLHTKHLR